MKFKKDITKPQPVPRELETDTAGQTQPSQQSPVRDQEPQGERRREEFSRRRLERWAKQARATAELYPDFDLSREIRDPRFQTLLRCGVPVLAAYEVCHLEDIKAAVARSAALRRERAVTEDIRARGGRPAENGAGSGNAVTARTDLERMTREDREELARRAAGGEIITLR